MFLSAEYVSACGWQAFERAIQRLLLHEGYTGVRLVGQSADGGADVIGHRFSKRFLFQAKYWKRKVSEAVIEETLRAGSVYAADVPVVISLNGFEEGARRRQSVLQSRGIPLQLWDAKDLSARINRIPPRPFWASKLRPYQEHAVSEILSHMLVRGERSALVVLATGLGKTVVAAEAMRRVRETRGPLRVLVIAHTNPLVKQLERAFWPFLLPSDATAIWNGYEQPSAHEVATAAVIVATVQSLSEHFSRGGSLTSPDVVIVDECHHAEAATYTSTLDTLGAGSAVGPFLLGLTATPWRADGRELCRRFGDPIVKVDLVDGMKAGFLANVDYRMYTDNIRWSAIQELAGYQLSPGAINRAFFVTEWDDAVVDELSRVWSQQHRPRALVFCGTVDHAITTRDKINQRGFARAAALYSGVDSNRTQSPIERGRILADFDDGSLGVLCAVDVLNEGIDVPDVNIVVFQRVTHSRRIFVQQLGRGLRLAPDKDTVIVLDFVSDIRRFAAGLSLKKELALASNVQPQGSRRISVKHKVTFRRVGGEDRPTERFLREWLEDVVAIEDAGDDVALLKFPPKLTDRES